MDRQAEPTEVVQRTALVEWTILDNGREVPIGPVFIDVTRKADDGLPLLTSDQTDSTIGVNNCRDEALFASADQCPLLQHARCKNVRFLEQAMNNKVCF